MEDGFFILDNKQHFGTKRRMGATTMAADLAAADHTVREEQNYIKPF